MIFVIEPTLPSIAGVGTEGQWRFSISCRTVQADYEKYPILEKCSTKQLAMAERMRQALPSYFP